MENIERRSVNDFEQKLLLLFFFFMVPTTIIRLALEIDYVRSFLVWKMFLGRNILTS